MHEMKRFVKIKIKLKTEMKKCQLRTITEKLHGAIKFKAFKRLQFKRKSDITDIDQQMSRFKKIY